MELRPLGRTGLTVSRLCCGALTLGPLQAKLSPEEGGELLALAFSLGVNFVDTAQLYGAYPHLREGLRRAKGDVVVCSKTYAWDEKGAREAVEEARRALDRDVIEIFLLHEQESEHTLRGHREALEALWEYKARGVIRAVGLSTHRVSGVEAATRAGLDVVHPLLNLSGLGIADGTRADMERAVRQAHDAGLGVFSMKALGGGHLFRRAREALSYVAGLPYVDAVAVGMKSAGEVVANVRFWETGEFSEEDAQSIAAQSRRLLREEHCTGCGACVRACPAGALSLAEGQARCDHETCVLCGYCGAACPELCLKIV